MWFTDLFNYDFGAPNVNHPYATQEGESASALPNTGVGCGNIVEKMQGRRPDQVSEEKGRTKIIAGGKSVHLPRRIKRDLNADAGGPVYSTIWR